MEDRLVLQCVAKSSRPLIDLHDPILARDVLESLRRKLDGGEAAVETMRRKRKVLVHALHYAIERGASWAATRWSGSGLRSRWIRGWWPTRTRHGIC
ncbi:hypothetical protein AB0P36_34540 [Streptomyces flavidovirens]|uniref:hypothetical protein n=1 Tax=Streptomyces flavidovirens TaxID=67298 RepID=UPI003436A264